MHKISLLLLLSVLLHSCVQKSVLYVEDDQYKKNVIQYCGGQLWGYIQPLDKQLVSSPYLAVYTNLSRIEGQEVLLLHIAFNFKNSAKITFLSNSLKWKIDNVLQEDRQLEFTVVEGFKNIDDRFPSHLYYTKFVPEENKYLVYKKKFGGFFGDFPLALEEPFSYTVPKKDNIAIKGNSHTIVFNPEINDEFYVWAVPILFMNQLPGSSKFAKVPESAYINIKLPKFHIDDKNFDLEPFVINFNRKNIVDNINGYSRCPSLEMMFHWSRSSFIFK